MTGARRRALVIVPTYNEKDNVLPLFDDASPDGTGDIVAEAAKKEPRIGLIRREGKLGLGTAYLAGFSRGLEQGYDYVFTMDADRSHNPRYLPAMLEMLDRNDMVIGSRYVTGGGIENWPVHRRALSTFANFYTRIMLGISVNDCTSGFRGYRREVLETVDPFEVKSSGYSFLYEMVYRVSRAGYQIGEVPIVFEQRVAGDSKINSSEIYIAALRVLVTAVTRPDVPKRPS
jgi:dolichol-phosphate mannosyltransferase